MFLVLLLKLGSQKSRASPGATDAFLTLVSLSGQSGLCAKESQGQSVKGKKYQYLISGCHCFLHSPAPETLRNQSVPHSFVVITTSQSCFLTMAVWCSNTYLDIFLSMKSSTLIDKYLLNIYCTLQSGLPFWRSDGKRQICSMQELLYGSSL